ncbi:uncharacterized protein LOC131153750 [Malania oleifera]|uniref:uncharacterized protein LOC131153750 n=1 Tax=Malania oleifera TaxID=397392 RepID=UPI0025ADB5D0|nr:uncharacterized protein LOC131153750 [Malania oleifera]
MAHLMSLVQGERETLKKFIHHFVITTLEIRNLDREVALVALTTTLQPRAFLYLLGKKPPANMGELMAKAQKYINLEEVIDTRRDRAEFKRKGIRDIGKPSRARKRQESNKPQSSSKGAGHTSKFQSYTPLNTPRTNVLIHIQDKGYVLWLEPMRTPSYKRNMSKYCQFHRNHRHDTEEYIHLKNEIEALIKRGHLLGFVKKLDRQREARKQKNPKVEKKEEQVVREIAMIFGRPSSGGDSGGT